MKIGHGFVAQAFDELGKVMDDDFEAISKRTVRVFLEASCTTSSNVNAMHATVSQGNPVARENLNKWKQR